MPELLFRFWSILTPVSDEWDSYFLTLPNAKVQKYVMGIYLTAAVIASVITFFILLTAGYQHSLELAVLFFTGGLVAAACRWHKNIRNTYLEDGERS
jgi:predicted PurR-regulated permease PerM